VLNHVEALQTTTPGVATNDKLLEHNNNFLCGIHLNSEKQGFHFSDISTGEFLRRSCDKEYADKCCKALTRQKLFFQRSHQKNLRNFETSSYVYSPDERIFTVIVFIKTFWQYVPERFWVNGSLITFRRCSTSLFKRYL